MTDREELVSTLIEEFRYTKEDLKGKRVDTLKEMVEQESQKTKEFEDTAKTILETGLDNEETLRSAHSIDDELYDIYNDPQWTEKAISLMRDDEKVKDKPRCAGLRRLANVIFGPISTKVNVAQTPDLSNKNKAAVCVSITTRSGITAEAVAEAHYFNTDKPYSDFPLATAETRAEARALKKILGLNIMAYEETELSGVSTNVVSQPTLTRIKMVSQKHNVDLDKLLAGEFPEIETIEELSQSQAAVVISKIMETTQKEG